MLRRQSAPLSGFMYKLSPSVGWLPLILMGTLTEGPNGLRDKMNSSGASVGVFETAWTVGSTSPSSYGVVAGVILGALTLEGPSVGFGDSEATPAALTLIGVVAG